MTESAATGNAGRRSSGCGDGGGLQLYTQLFTGYGDTLLDYNRRRSVFSVGVSMAEW